MFKMSSPWLVVVLVLVAATPMLAQDGGRRGFRGGLRPMSLQDAVKQLDLTAEQNEKAAPILKAYEDARQKLFEEMRQAFQGGDQAARTAVREKINALDTKTKKQLAEVLTKEQTAKVERMTGPGGAFDQYVNTVEKVGLTDQQKTHLKAVIKAANADAAAKPEEAGAVYQAAVTKITTILTDEQKTKLEQIQQAERLQAMVDRMLQDVVLTDEQKAKVKQLIEKAQKDSAAAADRQARREVSQKLMESIRNDVLTEEQRAKLPAPRSRQ